MVCVLTSRTVRGMDWGGSWNTNHQTIKQGEGGNFWLLMNPYFFTIVKDNHNGRRFAGIIKIE